MTWIALVGGLIALIIGAELLVRGATTLALRFGIRPIVVGLTVVSVGTSLPELAVGIGAGRVGAGPLTIGNLIGSSIYNLALILGATALASPLAVSQELIQIDLPVMIGVALLCIPVFLTGRRISRGEGALFIALYVAYLGFLIAERT